MFLVGCFSESFVDRGLTKCPAGCSSLKNTSNSKVTLSSRSVMRTRKFFLFHSIKPVVLPESIDRALELTDVRTWCFQRATWTGNLELKYYECVQIRWCVWPMWLKLNSERNIDHNSVVFLFRRKSDDRGKCDEFSRETRCMGKKVSGSNEEVIRIERRDLHCSTGPLATDRAKWENGKSWYVRNERSFTVRLEVESEKYFDSSRSISTYRRRLTVTGNSDWQTTSDLHGQVNRWLLSLPNCLSSHNSFEQRTVLKNHTNDVIATCYVPVSEAFPDGLIITGSNDKTICVYSAKQGTYLFTLEGHELTGTNERLWSPVFLARLFAVSSLSYVPHSDLLLSASWDTTGRVWSLSTRQCTQTLSGIWRHSEANEDLWVCISSPQVTAKLSGRLFQWMIPNWSSLVLQIT